MAARSVIVEVLIVPSRHRRMQLLIYLLQEMMILISRKKHSPMQMVSIQENH